MNAAFQDPGSAPRLRPDEFAWFRAFTEKQTGISLGEGKESLVSGRLQSMVRRWSTGDFAGLRQRLGANPPREMLLDFVNRITTNHTYFHREPAHYDVLRDLCLPSLRERCAIDRDVRLWCAAASTGQEPYELALVLRAFLGQAYGQWKAGVLATDIAEGALRFAMEGIYEADDVARLPADFQRHFKRTADGRLQATEALRRDVLFRRYNLVEPNYSFKQPFHVIFCRNVLIYFDEPTKGRVVRQLTESLVPGGYLIVGHTEALGRGRVALESVAPSVYRRVDG